ncbi:MAG: putative transport system permease protein [Actinomycetota bacterium]|jgi:putative ABC transport system permease protein
MFVVFLAGLVVVGLVLAAIRYPLVRRIGLRNAVRRPREAALVMLGCVLGTALIVGNSAVGDSFTNSIRRQALSDFGALDASVTFGNRDEWAKGNAYLAATPIKGVESSAAVAVMRAPITTNSSDATAPRANLIDADYRRAGQLGAVEGRSGLGPTTGQAWASKRLAAKLHLHVGSLLTVHTPQPLHLTVTNIVKNSLVSFKDGEVRAGEGVLVPPGTIPDLQAKYPQVVTPDWLTLVVGKMPHTNAPPDPVAVDALRAALTRAVTPFNGDVAMNRSDALKGAIAAGKNSATFLTTIGTFGIIAGMLLLINVLLMLAEERLTELGTMRAVGLSRTPLIGSFSLEGGIYAAVGATIGGAAGVGLGQVLVYYMNKQTNHSTAAFRGLPLYFAVTRQTVMSGVALGFLVSVLAVIGTSYRVSKLDVIRSLRRLPPQPRPHRRAATPLLIAGVIIGTVVTYFGYVAKASLPFLVGPILIAVAAGVLATRRFGWAAGTTIACVPLVTFTIVFNAINPAHVTGPQSAVLSGVVSVTAGVFLINAGQARIARFLRSIGRGRGTVPARLGLANPVAHRVRMLLTVGPFALVIFTLVYAEGLSHMISTELARTAPTIAGDYTLFASSDKAQPFDFTKFSSPNVTHVAPTGTVFASFTFDVAKHPKVWTITGFDKQMYDHVDPPGLVERDPKYKTDKAVYAAVLHNPDLVIVTRDFLLSGGFGPGPDDPTRPPAIGDTYTMTSPVTSQARDVTVVGIKKQDVFAQGPFYGATGMKETFGNSFALSDAMLVTRNDPTVATQLQHAGVDNGVEAVDIETAAREQFATLSGIINLFRSDLGIGVVVGIAGIAVVLVRSVRDRRHQIGVLRAMGFDAGEIGTSFLVEGAFVSAQGLVVGVGFGVLTVMATTKGELMKAIIGFQPPLRPPPVTVLILMVVLFLAALAASALPARSASKIPPAVALRLVD